MATAPEKQVVAASDERTKPPFLRRVRIRGYKSIAFCDVALEPLTILVGRNASGKSNFIDALAFLRDVLFDGGVNSAIKRRGGAESVLCRFSANRSILIEVECGYATPGVAAPWQATYSIKMEFPKKRPASVRHEYLRLTQDNWWMNYTNSNRQVTSSAADEQARHWVWDVKDRPLLDAYPDSTVAEFSGRLETLTAYNFRPEAIRQLQTPNLGWFLERDGSNLASVLETTRENEEEIIERVGRYLSVITESIELVGAVRYGEYETVRFRVNRKDGGSPLEFDAASMSDGTLRALAALVAAFQNVLPHGSPSLVAIEEPETSLHPAAMHALVSALEAATERTQVLLTTHSGDLLADPKLSPSSVLVVRQRDGRTKIAPVDPASREIIHRELYTLADLHRLGQLNPDEEHLERQAAAARED